MAQLPRYTPTTAAEVESIIAGAMAEERGLAVCGGGSKRPMRPPIAAAALLDMSALTGITVYDPDELVVTARAGTPLAEIEAALAERQQMLAFEPFDHAPLFGAALGRATLGGVVAANVSGSRRLSSGAARDHILGFTAVSGRGEALKGGGAVVKNVTGFDLPKLMAGSWGTLAVLLSVTMRVLPRPRAETTLLFRGLSDEAANHLMSAALATPAAVSAAAHVCAPRALTALRLEGFGPSVDARCVELLRVLKPADGSEAIEAEESRAFWRSVSTQDGLPRAQHVLWRISVAPARGWQVRSLLAADDAHYLYDWAGALVWAAIPEGAAHADGARLRAIARALGGHAMLIRAPQALRETLASAAGAGAAAGIGTGTIAGATAGSHGGDPGNHGSLQQLHRRLKAAFDPRGILNPGLDLLADL
jgi:glycolate oxidase FAD binding subunit